jgi:hypothetical protein
MAQSSRLDSNQRPTAYKAGALTPELREENMIDMPGIMFPSFPCVECGGLTPLSFFILDKTKL